MKAIRHTVITLIALCLVGQAVADNGQVKFRATVTAEERHNVMPVCYGDYFVATAIAEVLEDTNNVLAGIRTVDVCYAKAHGLAKGDPVEVYGYYWGGGTCPRQNCGRVQILGASDYILPSAEYGDNDWMLEGLNLYAIPAGNVGIGTSSPLERLHVRGNVLVEGRSPAWLTLMSGHGEDAGIAMTSQVIGGNTWRILRSGPSSDLAIEESFPYPPFSRQPVTLKARTGRVGIGTSEPERQLHVQGDVLIEASADSGPGGPLSVVKAGPGRQLAATFSNPQDGNVQVELQMAGGKMLPWGWSLKAASGMFTLGSVMVLPPALNITSLGNVGLGVTSPTYRLELPNTAGPGGQALANAWKTYSSGRRKTNVQTIGQAMDKVRHLRGVTFDWKDGGGRHDMGMIAEEVGNVVPEVVDYEVNGADATSIDYGRLVALLVEALKEQEARIADLEQALDRDRRLVERLEAVESRLRSQGVSLGN